MIFRLSFIFLSFSFSISIAFAQYDIIPVFPDLEGDELYDAVINEYKPSTVLTLAQARDTVYKDIYFEKDSVRCIYTSMSKFLPDNVDPSQHLFDDGGNDDINLEHSYPRSKGASIGMGNSDMHHLFPSRVTVNSARGSDPFGEINDDSTNAWYYQTETLNTIPTNNIDSYSEDTGIAFEPTEKSKGNIARAQFYFYTMYRDDANTADPSFFELQRENLCQWHEADPVDSLEWVRSFKIAKHQSEKANPFVLDCRLARMYCNDISNDCQSVNINEVYDEQFVIYPNVIRRGEIIYVDLASRLDFPSISIYNMNGQIIAHPMWESSDHQLKIKAPEIAGQFLLVIHTNNEILISSQITIN